MAILPRVVTEASASGAQVIDGSLTFDKSKEQYLTRTPSTAGNRKTFTWSVWLKRSRLADGSSDVNHNPVFCAGTSNSASTDWRFQNTAGGRDDEFWWINWDGGSTYFSLESTPRYRDTSGFYHLVCTYDGTTAKVYINGSQVTAFNTNTQNGGTSKINSTTHHSIGCFGQGALGWFGGRMSQFYLIDGQALDATYFGYTDPLTNTWRPKKFSGKYTGEFPLADYTGGLPILATNSLGTAVTSGTRADSNSANIVLAVPFNGNVTDYSATIKGSGSALVGSTDSTTYPTTNDKYYGSSVYQNADGDVAWYITGESAFTIGTGAFTVECWVRNDGNHDGSGGSNEDQYVWHFTDINMRLRMWKPSGGSRIITFYTADITNEPTVATVADNEWHHVAVVREGTGSNQFKIYVDGALSYTGTDGTNLSGDKFMVGNYSTTADYGFSGNIQDIRVYNAAKYTSAFTVPPDKNLAAGTNSFYLPFDGSAPIGKDQSGKGNDWTPVNFGGSTVISKATGALPILNTQSGGKVVVPGVRGQVGVAVTVAPKTGGGNAFYLDGEEAKTVSYKRGQTVTFDTSDSTVSGHPFRFATAADAAGSTQYTTGSVTGASEGSAGAATTITIPTTAPENLYYYCTNHSGMGSSITGITTDIQVADPYASYCKLAIPLVDNGNDVSDQVNIESTASTITNSGVDFVTTQSNFYGVSGDFTGAASDALSTGDDDAKFKMEEGDFTVECWVYSTTTSGTQNICQIIGNGGSTKYYGIWWNGTNLYFQIEGGCGSVSAGPVVIGEKKWHHLAMTRTGGKMRGFVDGVKLVEASDTLDIDDTGYQAHVGRHEPANNGFTGYIQDFRIYKGVAKYISNFVPASTNPDILSDSPSGVAYSSELAKPPTAGAVRFDGTNDKLTIAAHSDLDLSSGNFTVEGFVYPLRSQEQGFVNNWNTNSSGQFQVQMSSSGTLQASWAPYSTAVYAVTGTTPILLNVWSHFAYTRSGSTFELFLNGISQGTQTSSNNASANSDFWIGENSDGARDLQGFLSNIRVIKGTALYTSNFTPPTAPLTAVTNTKLLCCQSPTSPDTSEVSPGTITIHGDVVAVPSNPSKLGVKVKSEVDNVNTVLGQSTGYCTWNIVNKSSTQLLFNGSLDVGAASDAWQQVKGTIGFNSGKYYWEIIPISSTQINAIYGISDTIESVTTYPGGVTGHSYVYGGAKYDAGTYSGVVASSWVEGDVLGVAVDCDGGTIKYYINNIFQSSSNILTTKTWMPAISVYYSDSSIPKYSTNFGQKPFKYPPPDGYESLCTANLPSPGNARPDKYFTPTLYSGSGSGAQYVSAGFKPDMVWIKSRNNAWYWNCYDSVRGSGKDGTDDAAYYIGCNDTSVQTNVNAVSGTQFQGFYGGDTYGGYIPHYYTGGSGQELNTSGATYVGYCWKAGGGTGAGGEFWKDDKQYASAAAAGLDGGSITPTGASVGTKQGFSIIKYSGTGSNATLSHGLDSAPNLIMIKCLNITSYWWVYHSNLGATQVLYLNGTDNADTNSAVWNNTEPTATNISLGTADGVNGSGNTYVAYCWHDVPGVQKFGQYKGNQSTAGPFVELGFRPALLIIKSSSASSTNWRVIDDTRRPYNWGANDSTSEGGPWLKVNSNAGEANERPVDLLSNGFKIQGAWGGDLNYDSGTPIYIYAAWAHQPYHNLYGGQSNAR